MDSRFSPDRVRLALGWDPLQGSGLPLVEYLMAQYGPQPLSKARIVQGLGQLSPTPFSMAPTFVELAAPNSQVTHIGAIRGFPHLQVVQLSNNLVKDLSPLAALAQLRELYAANNQIDAMLDFEIPACNLGSIGRTKVNTGTFGTGSDEEESIQHFR